MILSRDHAYRMFAWRLKQAGIPNADLDARLLVQAACECDAIDMIREPGKLLAPAQAEMLEKFETRRLMREPVSRILGLREFWGLSFAISEAVLDPRPDSETLVETALDLLRDREAPRILDIGTGSGCLLLSLLDARADSSGIGVDISDEALKVAAGNARRLGSWERASFRRASWADGIDETFDLVISNPPYIVEDEIAGLDAEVRDYDPHLALSGGADGLDAYRAIAAILPRLLSRHGHAVIELGEKQDGAVRGIFTGQDLAVIRIAPDMAGIPRALVARRGP